MTLKLKFLKLLKKLILKYFFYKIYNIKLYFYPKNLVKKKVVECNTFCN